MAQMRAATPSTYHSLLLAGTPLLLPIPLSTQSTSRRANISEVNMPFQNRLLLTAPTPRRTMAAIEVVNLRVSYQALAMSEAYNRALEAHIPTIETQLNRMDWQRQDADDRAIKHIMRIQELKSGACVDTLEDTCSSS
nr:hypothetical protein [Tanacetum cinerariifolium]